MLTSTTLPQTTRNIGGTLYALILDAEGKPLALAPLRQLTHTSFPTEQLKLVNGGARLVETTTPTVATTHAELSPAFVRQVESALKRLYDLAFLCEHPLSHKEMVNAKLRAQQNPFTCLDRARVAHGLLYQAIEQLRPVGPVPARTDIPRREWHPYLILHCAYVEGEQNYSIMNWLQVSEGTFNRTRRRALQSVAQVLLEMEQHAA